MKLGQQLKIKQNQSLIMTPQLQQAIKLLQLTNIELSDFIDKAQLENPFLKETSQIITKKSVEEKNSDTYENMNSSLDPLKNDSKLDSLALMSGAAIANLKRYLSRDYGCITELWFKGCLDDEGYRLLMNIV